MGAADPAFIEVKAPAAWRVLWNTVQRLARRGIRTAAVARDPGPGLADAELALRNGHADEAAMLLAPCQAALANDPAFLNLLGVVCEARGQWEAARRFYGVAISLVPGYAPAQQNMRRIFELYTFGRSREPVAFGRHFPRGPVPCAGGG